MSTYGKDSLGLEAPTDGLYKRYLMLLISIAKDPLQFTTWKNLSSARRKVDLAQLSRTSNF